MNPNITVPLEKLRLSARNARKTGGSDVADLVASIADGGLLQNLAVVPGPEGYEVIAGGRRLKAMQLLASEGRLPADLLTDGVPCRVLTDEKAIEASTAENTIRVPMHPADQFDAFKAMIDAGESIADVAAHFSITETVVKQRLKLANVHPKLVQIYREEGMSLQQLQALAITDDHKSQLKAWTEPKNDWDREPSRLRARLTAREIRSTDPRVRFVGLDTYVAAGGAIRKDLFSTRDEAFLADGALLDRLVAAKLEQITAEVQAEGWSWVEYQAGLDYSGLAAYTQHPTDPTYLPPTKQDQARLKAIKARRDEIASLVRKIEDAAEPDYDASEALEEEDAALANEAQVLRQGAEVWPDAVKAEAGALLVLNSEDGLVIYRGRLKPGQRINAGKIEGKAKDTAPVKKPEISDALVHRLTGHRTLALQAALAGNPDVALKEVVVVLVENMERGMGVEATSALKISVSRPSIPDSPDLNKCAASQALQIALKRWREAGLPTTAAERRKWIYAQPVATLHGLLALAAAYGLNAVHGKDSRAPAADALAQALKLDMASWWQADADTYLGAVPKALAIEAVTEACGKDAAASLATLKSAAVVAEAAKKLAGTGWLPKVLREPGYALRKPGTQVDKATPVLKKSSEKKAAAAKAKPAAKKATTKKPAPKKAPAKTKPAKKGAKK
jgi:ParB family chromosome partitioning protein